MIQEQQRYVEKLTNKIIQEVSAEVLRDNQKYIIKETQKRLKQHMKAQQHEEKLP